MGGASDKDATSEFFPVQLSRQRAEAIYQTSWVMGRLVDTVVDDMFAAGRRWIGEDEGANKAMEDAEAELGFWTVLPDALRASRIWGSSLLVICPTDGDFESPIDPKNVKEGGVANLVSVDRWSLSVENWQTNPTRPRYGKPYQYRWSSRVFSRSTTLAGENKQSKLTHSGPDSIFNNQNILVNADRCLRFDGIRSPLTEGWTSGPWEREWGISLISRALDEVMRDATMAAATGHLVAESSVWVQKISGFRDTLATGRVARDDVSPEDLAEQVNELRSIYRTLFVDSEDDATRVEVAWGGLIEVLKHQIDRIAAVDGIPITRFRGTSASGLSATGEGDARDWRITVKAIRKKNIDPILHRKLDLMIARHAGIKGEPPEWEWNELGDMTDTEKAELTTKRTEATMLPFASGIIDEDEVRERLAQDEWWGELGAWGGPTAHEQLEMDREDEKAEEDSFAAEERMRQMQTQREEPTIGQGKTAPVGVKNNE